MFDLTVLDYIYIAIVFVSTVWATIRGGVYETIATLSWVVAAVAARFASPMVDGWLQSWFGLAESTVGTLVASYFIIFFAILIVVGFFNQKLRDWIQDSIMNVTDKTLGVIFGVVRGIVIMGVIYWGALWYYSDSPMLPTWLSNARTRPIMQVAAVKLDEWFVPGRENKLLARDMAGTHEALEIYKNLINPAVANKGNDKPGAKPENTDDTAKPQNAEKPPVETGYKSSERTALENQLLQIETAAKVQDAIDSAKEAEKQETEE
ncbi:MAG: CvpA family protein [Alphaproteobacteria bacterium]|nr:CvpA family protein [Alphaproteobacteria bacterium]